MKSLTFILTLLLTAAAFAQTPDPADSIIIESKYAAPNKGACASAVLRVRVYITNKDSLANVSLPLVSRTTSGGAYATISRPASCGVRTSPVVFDFLYPPAPGGTPRLPTRIPNFSFYHSDSPDSLLWTGTFDAADPEHTMVPPNPFRTALLDIKFDTVKANVGTFELDSLRILGINRPEFVNRQGVTVRVNFVKSTITVRVNGDMNLDRLLTPADVVQIINGIFRGDTPAAGAAATDVNCDGMGTSADVVTELNGVFLGMAFPCQ